MIFSGKEEKEKRFQLKKSNPGRASAKTVRNGQQIAEYIKKLTGNLLQIRKPKQTAWRLLNCQHCGQGTLSFRWYRGKASWKKIQGSFLSLFLKKRSNYSLLISKAQKIKENRNDEEGILKACRQSFQQEKCCRLQPQPQEIGNRC